MRRVVVTGLGMVVPHGDRPEAVFSGLMEGRSAIRRWEYPGLPPAAAGTVDEFDAGRWFTRLQLSGVDRVSQLAVAAAESAREDAAWDEAVDPERAGVFVGCGMGGAAAIERAYSLYGSKRRVPPLTVVAGMANAPAAHIAMRAKVAGPVLTYSVACASSAVALAEAARAIRAGDIDVAIAGGAEALLVPGVISAWQALQTLAPPDPEDPSRSCRPFAKDRNGFVLSEGAAMLVLESLAHAEARGARVYAEFAGSGLSCDASHLTNPVAGGQVRALVQALRSSGLRPADIGYCNAHGTATRVGDPTECESLRMVWADSLPGLQTSSTKSMHGHLLGAAGALEAAITALAVHRGEIPPTANCTEPDAACDISLVRNEGCAAPRLRAAISNSFAFGGTNAVLVFSAMQ